MNRIFAYTCALLLLHVSANAGIDFTATEVERTLSGIKFKQLVFQQDGKKIGYQPPRGWSFTGGGSRIKFIPPEIAQAQGEIDQVQLSAPQSLDEETMKTLQRKTLESVPADSRQVTLVSEEKNPLLINKNETYEVTVSYQAFGQEFQMSVLYMNLPDTQVRFRTTARKADFEKVHKAFRGSIFSWQWLPAAR